MLTINKFSEVETYFRKLSFWNNKFVKQILLTQKFFKKLQKIFAVVAVETLVWVETGGVWGGGGAQEVKIDLMPPRVPKVSIIF